MLAKVSAKHFLEHLGAATVSNDKQDGQGGDEGPEIRFGSDTPL